MDRPMIAAVEQYLHCGYDLSAAAILLCESDGSPEEVAEEIRRMPDAAEERGATALRVSADEGERLNFWPAPRPAFPAIGGWRRLLLHGRHHSAQAHRCDAAGDRRVRIPVPVRCANVFHAGDGQPAPPDHVRRECSGLNWSAPKRSDEILELSVKFGGTITGEHGVRIEKINPDVYAVPHARAGDVSIA